jgi:hypothetical protein
MVSIIAVRSALKQIAAGRFIHKRRALYLFAASCRAIIAARPPAVHINIDGKIEERHNPGNSQT